MEAPVVMEVMVACAVACAWAGAPAMGGVVDLESELPWDTGSSDSSWEPADTDEEMGSLVSAAEQPSRKRQRC